MANISVGAVPSYTITVNGHPISDSYQLSGMRIEQAVNRVASATLSFFDGRPNEQTFPISDSPSFEPGNTVSIALGYDGKNDAVFEGIVVGQALRADTDRGPWLEVLCKDPAVKLAVGRERATPVLRLTYGDEILAFRAQLNVVSEQARITGQVRSQGSAKLQPGDYLSLAGVGARFVGDHFVNAVLHEITDGNWITETSIGLKPQSSLDGITSQSEPRLLFDDQNKTLTVQTPGGNSVVLDDQHQQVQVKDQHGNSLLMSGSGITLKSGGDITLEADGKLNLKGTGGIAMQSRSGDIQQQARNITHNAEMQLTAKGGMSTQVQAGAELTLKAAMVMIN